MVPLITVILQGTIIYSYIIERKHYARSPRLLKQLYLALKDVLQRMKKSSVMKLNQSKNSRIFGFSSLIDIHMSCVLCLGDIMHK